MGTTITLYDGSVVDEMLAILVYARLHRFTMTDPDFLTDLYHKIQDRAYSAQSDFEEKCNKYKLWPDSRSANDLMAILKNSLMLEDGLVMVRIPE